MKNVLSMDKLGSRTNAAKEQISGLKESDNGLSQKTFQKDKSLEENRKVKNQNSSRSLRGRKKINGEKAVIFQN